MIEKAIGGDKGKKEQERVYSANKENGFPEQADPMG